MLPSSSSPHHHPPGSSSSLPPPSPLPPQSPLPPPPTPSPYFIQIYPLPTPPHFSSTNSLICADSKIADVRKEGRKEGRTEQRFIYIDDKLEWMTVNQLVLYHSLIAVYRIRQTNEPEYLANFLKNDNFRGQIIVPFTNLTLCQRSFCYRAAENWNVVPYMIRSLQRLDSFKRELKKWVKIKIPRFV